MFLTKHNNSIMCAASLEHAGFKLSCCDKKLCLFKYNELGLGMSLLAEVKAQPEVVDLLISFAFAACTGKSSAESRDVNSFVGCCLLHQSSTSSTVVSFINVINIINAINATNITNVTNVIGKLITLITPPFTSY